MKNLVFIFIFLSSTIFSQFGFDKIDHDFGEIKAGDDRVVDLKFRNTTNKKIYLLRIKHGREVRSLVASKVIQPDSLLIIRFKYNPNELGRFNIAIPVYLSNSMEPFVFTIMGNVKEIDNSMGLACPSFTDKGVNLTPIFDFKATVLDKETGDPIKDASVTFVSNGMVSQIEKTNDKGLVKTKSLIGLYYFVIDADKYIGIEFQKYVNRNNDSILVYLTKPKVEIPIVDSLPTEPLIVEVKEKLPVQKKSNIKEEIANVKNDSLVELKLLKQPINDSLVAEIPEPVITYKDNNIVFLLDVSTSMNKEGKLDLLKASLIEMVKGLRNQDKITLISYSTFSKVIIEATGGSEKELLIETIKGIKAQGMTAGGDGMKLAYRLAKKHFIEGGNNQVIMATDGKFNKGNTNVDRLVLKNKNRGIELTILGIKNKPEDAEQMSEIAKIGGGNFLLITNYENSKELLVNEIKRASKEIK